MKSSTRSQRNARFKRHCTQTPDRPALRLGDTGAAVEEMQRRMNKFVLPIAEDGNFGPHTHHAVCSFQYRMFLTEDGIVGPLTWKALFAEMPAKTPVLQLGSRSGEVREVQRILIRVGVYRSLSQVGVADGIFGQVTREAVKRYQADRHLQDTDGIVGRFTWQKLAEDRLDAAGYPIRQIDLVNRKKGHSDKISAIATAAGTTSIFTGSVDTLEQRWSEKGDRASTPTLGHRQGERGSLSDVVINPRTTEVISSTYGGTIRTGNFQQTTKRSFPGRGGSITAIDISPNGRIIAAGNLDRSVRLFTLTGGLEAQRTVHDKSVADIVFNPRKERFGGQLVSIDRAQQILLWKGAQEVGTPTLNPTVLAEAQQVTRQPAIALSNSGYLIAATGANRLRLFSTLGSLLAEAEYNSEINAVALSPCNRYLALACSDRTVQIIDLSVAAATSAHLLKPISILKGHHSSVTAVSFALSSAHLYSGDETGELLTWEIKR